MEKSQNGAVNSLSAEDRRVDPFPHFSTLAIHAGQEPEQWSSRAVVPPISLSTTFKQEEPGKHSGFEYSRSGNPTRNCTEKCIAALENGKHCMLLASGLAATSVVTHLLNSGDHVVSIDDVYGGTNRFFSKVAENLHVKTTFVDATDPELITKAIQPNTKMVWIETPTNPTMKLVDISAVCDAVHKHPGVFVVVDNTFTSSYFQRPLELGADICVHSLTKYMNGHSDVVMGAVILNDDELASKIRFLQNAIGAVPSPFDCYLVNRGLKTLAVRMQAHMKNALQVAHFLEASPRVIRVVHPGLKSHPQYELGLRQMKGYSGMVTFFIKGGVQEASKFLSSLKLFTLAESLGGFESLAEHPAIMTHASVAPDHREFLGISDSLVRLSVGLEDANDLIEDIDQALKKAVPDV
jgi:cystathionine gamma-lyase